uniref:Nitric oxide synthase, inducible n=1 Tax=Rattus norvegicus TaxID=10116 RepID=A0ABK0L9Q5_RAT
MCTHMNVGAYRELNSGPLQKQEMLLTTEPSFQPRETLKWYALPAMANMLLEVCGLEFPTYLFNDWYRGGAPPPKPASPHLLQEVGRRMGLETHTLASLWKDRAVTEINAAVLHSFQKQNVTIMDHHTASESFMKHMQNEYRARGGCPADWIWLVPPVSGSITPVFHQEMLNYVLSLFYYYQIEPWKTHIWQDEKLRPRRREIRFTVLVKVVFFASVLMRKVMASPVRATVLFATETGKSEALARDLAALFSYAFNTKVVCMEQYKANTLEEEQLLLVVTSTFDNGDCPSNGQTMKKSLFMMKELGHTFRYAVFGLGSSMYPQFCAFAHDIDQKLSHLGASQLAPTGEGDELSGQEDAFRSWAVQTFRAACETFDVQSKHCIQIPKRYISNATWEPEQYKLTQSPEPQDLNKALSSIHVKNVFTMRLKSLQNLQSEKSSRTTLLIQLTFEGSRGPSYLPGEDLGIFPVIPPLQVEDRSRLRDPRRAFPQLDTFLPSNTGRYWVKDKTLPPCSLRQALTYFLDITTPPTQLQLHKLAQFATEETHRQRLEALCQPSEYNDWKFSNNPTFLEVLEGFPSLRVPAAFLLLLPVLKPRYYSISSSQDHTPSEVHLTVVTYRTRDGQGPLHHGVCSTWINNLKPEDPVPCFVLSVSGFQLPEDPSQPCILIGPGTGIAPFRSFWQQRLHDSQHRGLKGGRMTLVFGCRHPEEDHLYQEEMQEMVLKGVLFQVHTGYSRLPGKPKVYVQDILQKELANVFSVLHGEQGHLYVCGDVRMARDVATTLKKLVAAKLNLSEEQVEDYFFQLKVWELGWDPREGSLSPRGTRLFIIDCWLGAFSSPRKDSR